MPVKKISDAPANIHKLDDVELTLAQINYILRIYDALDEDEVESRMAVAIAQFKKAYHVDGDKWVKNKSGEGASMIDLEHLEWYIVIQTGDREPGTVQDLREMEGDFGNGVYPLWSDGQQSIVAFAFEPGLFKETEAQEWVRQAMEKPKDVSAFVRDVVRAVIEPVARAFAQVTKDGKRPQALRSFDEIRRLVDHALMIQYPENSDSGELWRGPWIVEMGTSNVIIEFQGQRYVVSYQIDENDWVTLGQLEPVDDEWVRQADGSPVMLHAFSVHLGAGDEADDGEDDGLVWKELIHPGKWFKSDSGRLVEVTVDMIKSAFDAWKAGLPKLISVPSDGHHDHDGGIVPVESNRGFVAKLKMIGDRLFGGFKFTDPAVAYGVSVGNVADVSVYLNPDVIHPDTGDKYSWILEHVLLTNAPLAQDLEPFGAVPVGASGSNGQVIVQTYTQVEEVNSMSGQSQQEPQGVAMSAEDQALLGEFKGLGLSITDVKAMADERAGVRQKARDLEITRVVRAMEGVETHDGIVQVDGFRHYPVVCVAVEKTLRERPEPLALSADGDGKMNLDQVIFDLVNAIPQEGRMALATQDGQPSGSKDPPDPSLQPGDQGATDEQIDELATRVL